jgi:hypothetical protein
VDVQQHNPLFLFCRTKGQSNPLFLVSRDSSKWSLVVASPHCQRVTANCPGQQRRWRRRQRKAAAATDGGSNWRQQQQRATGSGSGSGTFLCLSLTSTAFHVLTPLSVVGEIPYRMPKTVPCGRPILPGIVVAPCQDCYSARTIYNQDPNDVIELNFESVRWRR